MTIYLFLRCYKHHKVYFNTNIVSKYISELFRSGVRRIMIATESLAPRIDFTTVHHVINFDLPSHFEEYILRITCTGKLGKLGLVTSFFNDKNWNLSKQLKDLISTSKQEPPNWLGAVNIDVNNGHDNDTNNE